MKKVREVARQKRHRRIALKMKGTPDRPRLVVRRSLNNMYAQFVDDLKKQTIFSLSTNGKEMKGTIASGGNVKASAAFGAAVAIKAKEKGVSKIIFDRAGYLYHGRVKVFAEALRKGGLEF